MRTDDGWKDRFVEVELHEDKMFKKKLPPLTSIGTKM